MSKKEKNKGFIYEFKQFITRGNVVQMAVGIVIGAAFSAIVTAFVSGIINPVIGLLIGNVDFSELKVVLKSATEESAEVAILYGVLIQKIVEFVIVAFVLFLVVKGMNRLEEAKKKKEEEEKVAAPAPTPEDILLLKEIRDLLKDKN